MSKKFSEKTEGRIVIKAGAGTGKTTALIKTFEKILRKLMNVYDIKDSCSRILSLTFNRLAAKEIKERIIKNFENDRSIDINIMRYSLSVFTIDSFCSRFLRENSFYLNFSSDFKVLEEAETKLFFYRIAEDILDKKGFDIPDVPTEEDLEKILQDSFEFIQKKKSEGITPEDFSKKIKDKKDKFLLFLYSLYEEELKKKNFIDFSGLLLNTFKILEKNKNLLFNLQSRYDYILVDEYQDTSPLQMKLLNLIAEKKGNYFVVGDIKQSIYGFRNVNPYNIEEEAKKGDLVLELKDNFRSSKSILNFVNRIFENKFLSYKKLKPARKDLKEIKPKLILTDSYSGEAEFICKSIKKLIKEEGYSYSDFAILLRSLKTHVSSYEKSLRENHIPYYTLSGSGFYERDEILDVMSFLKFLSNPHDDISLLRILSSPVFNYSFSEIQSMIKNEKGSSLFEKIADNIPQRLKFLMEEFLKIKDRERMGYVAAKIIKLSSYYEAIKSLPESEKERKYSNIRKLLKLITSFESRNFYASFSDFFSYMKEIMKQEVVESEEAISGKESVTISTIHQVKGLEYKVVFVANINKSNFPAKTDSKKNIFFEKKELDEFKKEELRLFYVALTRAIERLYLLSIVGKESEYIKDILKEAEKDEKFLKMFDKEFYEYQGEERIPLEVKKVEKDENIIKILEKEKDFSYERKIKYLTVTKLSAFHYCPFFYKLQYEFKYPYKRIDEEEDRGEIEYPVIGNVVHYVLERNAFNRDVKLKNLINQSEKYLNAIGISMEEKKNYVDKVSTMLKNYIDSALYNKIPWAVELPVVVFNGDIEIKGTIDRIDSDFTIIDYKTGSDKFIISYEFSMNLYRIMLEEIFNLKVKSLKLFYLNNKNFKEVKMWENKKTGFLVQEYIKQIKKGIFERKIKEAKCNYCPYREVCMKG